MTKLFAPLLTILVLAGCAGAVTIEELEDRVRVCEKAGYGGCKEVNAALDKRLERFYRRGENLRRWNDCEALYSRSGAAPLIVGHSHDRHRRHAPVDIKMDLMVNQCMRLLKRLDMW